MVRHCTARYVSVSFPSWFFLVFRGAIRWFVILMPNVFLVGSPYACPTSWFVKAPMLHPKEDVLIDQLAARQVGWRGIGGRLVVTDRRVVFTPNAVDRRTGGRSWECGLDSVRDITVERRSDPPCGRLARIRLQVFVQTDSDEEAFLVNRAHHVGTIIKNQMVNGSR